MYKIEENLTVKDGSNLYSNEFSVLQIDSPHRKPAFNPEDASGCQYSESVFSTTGGGNWRRLIASYDWRCEISEEYGDIPTVFLYRAPVSWLKTDAFSLSDKAIINLIYP